MGLNLNANTATLGERLTLALVLLGFVVEMLSDNYTWGAPKPEPVTIEQCQVMCAQEGAPVKRYEAWACECAWLNAQDRP